MMQDASPRAAPDTLEPTASLTSVRVRRRKAPLAPTGKRGDLTEAGAVASAPVATPELPVIVLPPPAERVLYQDLLPFADLPLPEPAAEPAEAEPADEAPPQAAAPEEPPAESEPLDLLLTDELDALVELPEAPEASETPEPRPALRLVEAPPADAAAPEPAPEPELWSDAQLEAEAEAEAEAELEVELEAEAERAEHEIEAEAEREVEAGAELQPSPEAEAPAEPDILDYWDSLRGGRDIPALDELDRAHVGATWPNTLLLAVDPAELPRITRLGAGDGEIEYTATVIDWIMSRGRTSAKRGEPMEEERRFAVAGGSARYRLLLLPMSSYGLACDHVLCQLSHIAEIGKVTGIKRWFAW